MITTPNGRRERLVVAAGLALGVAIVSLGRGIPRLREWTANEQEKARVLQEELRRANADIRALPRMSDSAQARRYALGDAIPSLFHGTTAATMSASLAEVLSDAAEQANLRIGAIDVRADTAGKATYVRVAARTDVTGDVRGITTFLASLEGGKYRLAIRDMSIIQASPDAPDQQAEVLRTTVRVEGLARRPVKQAASGQRGSR